MATFELDADELELRRVGVELEPFFPRDLETEPNMEGRIGVVGALCCSFWDSPPLILENLCSRLVLWSENNRPV